MTCDGGPFLMSVGGVGPNPNTSGSDRRPPMRTVGGRSMFYSLSLWEVF